MKFLSYALLIVLSFLLLSMTGDSLKDIFPQIEGLTRSDTLETYHSDNLYDYINGAADSYIKYDFSELILMRYEGPEEITLKIEVYKHSNSLNAFGIYSNEKPFDSNWLNIGAQGYAEEDIINFYKGSYYVKIISNDIGDEKLLVEAAEFVADKLEGETAPPALSLKFPGEGKVLNSERYVNKNFLGYKTLSEAFTAEYEIGDHYFKLFIINKDSFDECVNMLQDYAKSIKHDTAVIKEGKFTIADPYQANIQMYLKENMILGILDLDDPDLSGNYMNLLIDSTMNN